jgi:hypothetical protein
MDIDLSPTSRKRRHPSNNDNNSDDDGDNEQTHGNSQNETSSKRLQNPQGLPIARQTHYLNTHIILQSLAFTRLRVTANFSLYNPHTSPVLICVTRESDSLYRTLWSVCSTSLQTLSLPTSILTSPSQPKHNPLLNISPLSESTKPLHYACRAKLHIALG